MAELDFDLACCYIEGMRTRRSPRNQERLFRELFKGEDKAAVATAPERCWDCANYPKGGRSRGHCTLKGDMVQGIATDRPCFRARSKASEENR